MELLQFEKAGLKAGQKGGQDHEFARMQKPIKEKYQEDAESAKITLRAKGSQVDEGPWPVTSISAGRSWPLKPIMASVVRAPGLLGRYPLRRVAGCSQITAQMVAEAIGLEFQKIEAHVEGDLDLRGTFGIEPGGAGRFYRDPLRLEVEGDVAAGGGGFVSAKGRAVLRGFVDSEATARRPHVALAPRRHASKELRPRPEDGRGRTEAKGTGGMAALLECKE